MPKQSSGMSFFWFNYVWHLNLLSSFSLTIEFLYTQHLQNWHTMKLLLTTLLQIAQGKLHSIVTFPTLSLPVINFVFLTSISNTYDYNAPLQAFSLAFRASNVSLTNSKSSALSISSACCGITSLDSASSAKR